MQIYTFDPETSVYTGIAEADVSPLDKKFIIPAFATKLEPPETGANQLAVFEDGAWRVVADHIGTTYWLADGSEHVVTMPGDLPSEALLEPPELRSEDQILTEALDRLDLVHAALIRDLTGHATSEGPDIWLVKESAARAVIAETASLAQISMLTAEAHGTGDTAMDLAQEIVARADTVFAHIGSAGAIRRRHRADMQTAHAAAPGAGQLAQDLDQILAVAEADSAALLAST